MCRLFLTALVFCGLSLMVRADDAAPAMLLKPARVFDGVRNKQIYTTGAGAEGICRSYCPLCVKSSANQAVFDCG